MTGVVDESVTPLLTDLLDCLAREVAKLPDPPKLVMARPGGQVSALLSTTDDECCEGLAWVRVASLFPSSELFPNPDQLPQRCPPEQWAAMFELGLLRCAPTPQPNDLTSATEWTALARQIQDDAAALRRAACCFLAESAWMKDQLSLLGIWQPVDVEGGCTGGLQPLTVAFSNCECGQD